MHINSINRQSFGMSYSENAIKTLNAAKNQTSAKKSNGLSLYKQLLLKNGLFTSKNVCESIKADYFAYLANLVK